MVNELQKGQTLHCDAGTIEIVEKIGSGGQATVYKVRLNGSQYALKIYFPQCCNEHIKKNLLHLIDKQAPHGSKSFLWPLHFVEVDGVYGYVMDLLPSGYNSVANRIGGEVNIEIKELLLTCINLCDSFNDLYSLGYSYKDISEANVCFNPNTGDVRILDNDNITPNTEGAGVKGTPRFMAPELVEGHTNVPTYKSDLHALAVLLFEMLFCQHPLEGNCQGKSAADDDFDSTIYGYKACFIFKDSNNLDRYIDTSEDGQIVAKQMWQLYPEYIRQLFIRAFKDGVKDVHARPDPREWRDAFIKAMGMLYSCQHCDEPKFFNKKEVNANQGLLCPDCGKRSHFPVIRLDKDTFIVINDGDCLTAPMLQCGGSAQDTILKVEYSNGMLRFLNCSDRTIECGYTMINKGEYTDYIASDTKLYVDRKTGRKGSGKELWIALF